MSEDLVMVSVKFPTDLVTDLRALADASERTLSAELRYAARCHLASQNRAVSAVARPHYAPTSSEVAR